LFCGRNRATTLMVLEEDMVSERGANGELGDVGSL
jgi:hypothetical protein